VYASILCPGRREPPRSLLRRWPSRATAGCPRPTFPHGFGFAAGHRNGIILVANYASLGSVAGTAGSTVALDTRVNRLRVPIVGAAGQQSGQTGSRAE
jgi:hypothetical protein